MPDEPTKALRATRGQVDVKKAVDRLARSLAEIEAAVRRAERGIEADRLVRIRTLRREAIGQLAVLCALNRAASRLLWQLSTAPERSRGDLERAADRALLAAQSVADAMIERFRRFGVH